jgi:sporulation protein YqfC
MGRDKKGPAERAAVKLARGIDYPVDPFLDVPSVHITGRDAIIVEGCKGFLLYTENRLTLDMGDFTVSIYGSDIELQSLSRVELALVGRLSSITYDKKEGGV